MTLEELKAKYDTEQISEIELSCQNNIKSIGENRKEFILKLYYLERTKRFKENKIYANSSFSIYINNVFNLRYSTYNKERFAYIAFPELTIKYGSGLVNKVKQKCGIDKIATVFDLINKTVNVNHNQIEAIIDKHRLIKESNGAYKVSKKYLEEELVKKDVIIKEQKKSLYAKEEQIIKLFNTIKVLKEENIKLKQELDNYRKSVMTPQNQEIMTIVNRIMQR